jgi:hypothetical protein
MSGRSPQDAWVERVLGFVVTGEGAEPGGLDQELLAWRDGILEDAALLADKQARPRIKELGRQVGAAITEGKLGGAHSLLDAMDTALNEAKRAARNRSVTEDAGSKVEYAKLLLRWRQAQSTTRDRIQRLASGILADPEVIDDPRFDEVVEAAADLVAVMPDFGAELENVLDGLDKIADPGQRTAQVEIAREQIDRCRQLLDGADELAELSAFAADEYAEADLAGSLREALIELASTLPSRI